MVIRLLVILAVNLVGTTVIYSLMAFFLTRFHWHGRGVLPVIVTIIAVELFWGAFFSLGFDPCLFSLCFGNWLVSAFSVILLSKTVQCIPRQFEDSARLDGCGWCGVYWHVILPLVRRELGLIALLTLMATGIPFWICWSLGENIHDPFLVFSAIVGLPVNSRFACMLALSVLISVPIIGIFLVTKRQLGQRR